MASKRNQRQKEIHYKVMRMLHEDPSVSTREIARTVGISNGAAYYCVTALIEKGFVKFQNFSKSQIKTNYLYQLTPQGLKEKAILTVQFLDRKKEEFRDLKDEIERLENELGLDDNDLPIDNRGSL